MSMFENDQYRWRENLLRVVRCAETSDTEGSAEGAVAIELPADVDQSDRRRTRTVRIGHRARPDDFAALDVCYLSGDEVTEQAEVLSTEMQAPACSKGERARIERLRHCTGRFDVLHFEQLADLEGEPDEMLDPSTLLIVLEALVELSDGVAVDHSRER